MEIVVRAKPAAGLTRCAWCHETASIGRVCPGCSTRLHLECAQRAGRCPTLGCSVRLGIRGPRRSISWARRWGGRTQPRRPTRPGMALGAFDPQQPLTGRQIAVAELVGVLAPVVCLVFDPFVFKGSGALFSGLAPFAYALILFQMVLLQVGLSLRGRSIAEEASFVGGGLLVGAAFAFATGLALLPLSLVGLVFGIGLLGLTPFVTARVYGRIARRCFAQGGGLRWAHALLGAAIAVLGPLSLALAG